jgi:hypothetical protein
MPAFEFMNLLSFFFEVLDKEPSIQWNWSFGLLIGFIGFFFCRMRWWMIVPVFPITLICAWILIEEFLEPFIGSSMWAESHSYVIQLWAAAAIAVLFPVFGALRARKHPLFGGGAAAPPIERENIAQ